MRRATTSWSQRLGGQLSAKMGEYLQFLQPGVECKIVSLQKNVVNVVEIADQLVAGVAVLRSAPRLAISQL